MTTAPDNSAPAGTGVLASVQRLARSAVAVVHNRVELLAVEFEEAGGRVVGLLLLGATVVGLGLLTLTMLIVTLLIAVGEAHRLTAAAILTTVCLLGTVGGAGWLRARIKNWSAFPATRAELRKDREWLSGKHPDTGTSENGH